MPFQQYPFKGGVPSGTTAQRPASPVTGDVFYDGTLGFLLIWDGEKWLPCSAPAAQPTISVVDVGTSRAYGSGAVTVTFTEGTSGGKAAGFTAFTSSGTSYTQTSTSNPITLVVGNNGSYNIAGTAYNGFGTSPSSLSSAVDVTTVPQAPTVVSASTSGTTSDVVVTWTLGSNGGKNLTSITITPFLNGTTAGTAATASSTSATSHTFAGLTQLSSYTFKVKATNANGTGLESTTNSVTIPTFFTVDYLVIAGGGGGQGGYGGGGGAGGFRTSAGTSGRGAAAESSLSLAPNANFSVSIGGGGAGGSQPGVTDGNVGTNSTFHTITSAGGGKGSGNADQSVRTGGSGGGGGSGNTTNEVGLGTTGQGYDGGYNTAGSPNYGGGGGGGAGGAGANGTSTTGGAGGAGQSSSISGSSVTYAGGGGGGTYQGGTRGLGGSGGGGDAGVINSSTGNNGSNGSTNTGGGGGAAVSGTVGYNKTGGNGGSGIIILRYPDTRTISFGAGVTGTESSASGGFKRATITAGSGNVSWT